jgi:TorA maturation chaperone TorD
MHDDTDDHDRHGARAALYSALAGAFCYPEPEPFADLAAPETLSAIGEAGETLGLEAEAAALREALAAAELDRLQATHMELFGLPSDDGEYPVVPYEANYTVREDIGQQQRRIAKVAGAVDALGFGFDDEFDERHDHVAVELELLQVLAAWRVVAARTDDVESDSEVADLEATLLAEHLVDFVPAFAADLRAATDADLYLAAADLAEALVTTDHARREATATVAAPNGGEP